MLVRLPVKYFLVINVVIHIFFSIFPDNPRRNPFTPYRPASAHDTENKKTRTKKLATAEVPSCVEASIAHDTHTQYIAFTMNEQGQLVSRCRTTPLPYKKKPFNLEQAEGLGG